jgi:hypothetical protein
MREEPNAWLSSLTDPFRDSLLKTGDELPKRIMHCAPLLDGKPAFDPEMIDRKAREITLPSNARFEHPLLERAVRVGLAHIDVTFVGDHPKYGVGNYASKVHDSFPPTIIAVVDALTLWGMTDRAQRLFSYWLHHFVREDGTIDYYGPSLSEYGQLLTTARRLMERGAKQDWLTRNEQFLSRLASYLRQRLHETGKVQLVAGVPEADERETVATYFHNNAWIVRGFEDWAHLLDQELRRPGDAESFWQDAAALREILLNAIDAAWTTDPNDWWLSPTVESMPRPEGRITANRLGSYTNYRYWPELLSSGVLPKEKMRKIVTARLNSSGQFLGMTRFMNHLDDWTLMEYLEGLWQIGSYDDYRLSLWGHICFHQAKEHLTAYEQVTLPPGRKVADYCLPCQLVAVRAAHKLSFRRQDMRKVIDENSPCSGF